MYVQRHQVDVVTAADGSVIGYTPVVSGEIRQIVYEKHATTPFDAGVDFAITIEETGENVWTEANVNASVKMVPRAVTHSQAGIPLAETAPLVLARDRVKISITNGGDTKNGTFYVLLA